MRDNWALLRACDVARANDAPVVIAFNLLTKFLGAGARQFGFMLRGLRELEGAAKAKKRDVRDDVRG